MAAPRHSSPPSNIPSGTYPADDAHSYEKGYPLLSYYFSRSPRYLHLRRFSALASRLLLYRQSELVYLEKKLLEMDKDNTNRTGHESNRSYHSDHGWVLEDDPEEAGEYVNLLNKIRNKMKEYEEDLIRFEKLGLKGWNMPKLKDVQKWLEHPKGCGLTLNGSDSEVWGYTDPQLPKHAGDLIQIVQEPESSPVSRYLQDGLSRWPAWTGKWLTFIFKRKVKGPDESDWYSHRVPWFEGLSLAIGFVLTSGLVYAAITSMYFVSEKTFNLFVVIGVPFLISIFELGFTNQKFVAMLATICAVLVTLSNNNEKSQNQARTSV